MSTKTWTQRHENLHTLIYLARRRWGQIVRYCTMVMANRAELPRAHLWYLARGRWRLALPTRWHAPGCCCYCCYI